jgi:hypothetical protein
MEQREMLELAALAFWGDEIDDVCSIRWLDAEGCIGYTHADNQDHNGHDVELCWEPHTDDGDSRRLEVRLKIDVLQRHGAVGVQSNDRKFDGYFWERFDEEDASQEDIRTATRMAVLKAAAEIGKSIRAEGGAS